MSPIHVATPAGKHVRSQRSLPIPIGEPVRRAFIGRGMTMVIVFACGAATGAFASRLDADLQTPWMGVWERVSAAGFMLWVAVLAAVLRPPPSKGR